MYYDDGTYLGYHPSEFCIFNTGVLCSSYFKASGTGYVVCHENCKNCGWHPDVKHERMMQVERGKIKKAEESLVKKLEALQRANNSLTFALEQQVEVNNYLKTQLDKKNKELVELRVKLGKDK